MTTYGYIRVSTDKQTTANQKLAILDYSNRHGIKIDNWIEVKASSRKTMQERKIDDLLKLITHGDLILVSELSRIGRTVGQIITIVDKLLKSDVSIIFLKENLNLSEKADMQKKVIMTMFSLFAEIERDLISERTKEGLARARAEGKLLGRPKGIGKSKLDGKEDEIREYLKKGVSKASIAKIYDVSWPCVDNFIKSRRILK